MEFDSAKLNEVYQYKEEMKGHLELSIDSLKQTIDTTPLFEGLVSPKDKTKTTTRTLPPPPPQHQLAPDDNPLFVTLENMNQLDALQKKYTDAVLIQTHCSTQQLMLCAIRAEVLTILQTHNNANSMQFTGPVSVSKRRNYYTG